METSKKKGFPGPMTSGQKRRYADIQKAEIYPTGLNIHAGNELGFRSKGKRVLAGADKSDTFGMKIRRA
tara:strand:+ start:11575 stop:11781 length:207 start_codon:yes stop_codon:yes gene_type:complete